MDFKIIYQRNIKKISDRPTVRLTKQDAVPGCLSAPPDRPGRGDPAPHPAQDHLRRLHADICGGGGPEGGQADQVTACNIDSASALQFINNSENQKNLNSEQCVLTH